jgi:2-isopropylmalate synthase
MTVELYDTTLRDGAQMEGISLSVEDKLRIAKRLDDLGIHYIEGGWPGANPKDIDFFEAMRGVKLNARLVAFGSTRRAGIEPADDSTLNALVNAGTDYVTIVGKANDFHVREVLGTSLEENLAMLGDSVRYLKSKGKAVFFDAEHFFDGFALDPEYALACLRATVNNGVDGLVLCDTNGGTLTNDLLQTIEIVQKRLPNVYLSIHCHNDAELAVANSLAAVRAGVHQVQACINGYGERCGNANMISLIAGLKLKMGQDVVDARQLAHLAEVSQFVSAVANLPPWPQQPYVGASAFAHKAGYHADGVLKAESAYQHVDPQAVGNERRLLVSELSGSRGLLDKIANLGIDYPLTRVDARRLAERIKETEALGYQYEGADASFEMLVRRSLPGYKSPFKMDEYFAIVHKRRHDVVERDEDVKDEAIVKLYVPAENGQLVHTAADGNGPFSALDAAVRKALSQFYPALPSAFWLVDYSVRITASEDASGGTASAVRVLIEWTDGDAFWETVGASTDIIEASWLALADSLEWWLLRHPV